jgi:hypothetical protein
MVEGPVSPSNPYTLTGVSYVFRLAADVEFPTTLPDAWVYCRFINDRADARRVEFAVEAVWLDGRNGEETTSYYPGSTVAFRDGDPVASRVWRLPYLMVFGEGRYELRLQSGRRSRLVAREFIRVERES